MQTATESIDLRSVLDQLERLKSAVSAIIDSEKALIKNRAERLLEKRAASREAVNHNERHGTLETFRPYAMPDDTRLDELTPTYAESPAN